MLARWLLGGVRCSETMSRAGRVCVDEMRRNLNGVGINIAAAFQGDGAWPDVFVGMSRLLVATCNVAASSEC